MKTIIITFEGYRGLSHQFENKGKTKEEILQAVIAAAVGNEWSQYDPVAKRWKGRER